MDALDIARTTVIKCLRRIDPYAVCLNKCHGNRGRYRQGHDKKSGDEEFHDASASAGW